MRKLFIIGLIISMLFMSFSFNVSATVSYQDNFDIDETVGEYPVSSIPSFYNWESVRDKAHLYVSDSIQYSGDNCVKHNLDSGFDYYLNFTTEKQVESFSILFRAETELDTGTFYWRLQDTSGNDVYLLEYFEVADIIYFKNGHTDVTLGSFSATHTDIYHFLNFTVIDSNTLNITVKNVETGTNVVYTDDSTLRSLANWDSIFCDITSSTNRLICYDNLKVDFSTDALGVDTELPELDATIRINVFDEKTGSPLALVSHNLVVAFPFGYDYAYCYLLSDLWSGDYLVNSEVMTEHNPIDIDVSFSPGSKHWIKIAYPVGFVDYETIIYQNYTINNDFYIGSVFNVNLRSGEYSEDMGWNNCERIAWSFCDFPSLQSGEPALCTDKSLYYTGEQVLARFRIPIFQELYECWQVDGDKYKIWIYDNDNRPFNDHGVNALYTYPDTGYISSQMGGQWQTFEFSPTNITGGWNDYTIYVGHSGGGIFDTDYDLCKLGFTVVNGTFSPTGEITGITPNPAHIGQYINISWTANNNGYITIQNLLDPSGTEKQLTTFNRFNGTHTHNRQIFKFGAYRLRLFVYGQSSPVKQDYEPILYVNTTNQTLGEFGYGIEFLTVTPENAIAGYDNVHIDYNTLNETTSFYVVDARGQTTSHSFLKNNGSGHMDFLLEPYDAVGQWTIMMMGNETLTTTFNVVAKENNWVSFKQNSYYVGTQFNLNLKHDVKVELEFFLDDNQIGNNIVFLVGENEFNEDYKVTNLGVSLTEGEWKVNMWEVNRMVRRELLASDICNVIVRPIIITEIDLDIDSSKPFYENPIIGIIGGLLVIIVLSLFPLVLSRAGVTIPNFVFGVFISFGLVVNVIIGLWEFWTLMFILIMMVLLILYEQVRKSNG